MKYFKVGEEIVIVDCNEHIAPYRITIDQGIIEEVEKSILNDGTEHIEYLIKGNWYLTTDVIFNKNDINGIMEKIQELQKQYQEYKKEFKEFAL